MQVYSVQVYNTAYVAVNEAQNKQVSSGSMRSYIITSAQNISNSRFQNSLGLESFSLRNPVASHNRSVQLSQQCVKNHMYSLVNNCDVFSISYGQS